MVFAVGTISLIRFRWSASGDRSEMPVTLPPGCSRFFTSWAPTGSVTAVNTTGMSWVAATTAWAEGVAIGTITFGFSPTNFCAIWAAVAGLPWADSYWKTRLSPSL